MKKLLIILACLNSMAMATEFGSAPQLGVRQQGMGEAFTGLADDGEATYFNQAGLVNLKEIEGSYMYSRQSAGLLTGVDGISVNVSNLGYAQNLGDKIGSFGVRWFYRGAAHGELYQASEHNVLLGFGHSLTQYFKEQNNPYMEKFSVGLGTKILYWGFYDNDGQKFYTGNSSYGVWNLGWELSSYYQLLDNYSIGFVVKDLFFYRSKEADKDYNELIDYRLGFAWRYNPLSKDDVVMADLVSDNDRVSFNIGSERYFDLKYQNQTDRLIGRGGFVVGTDDYYSLTLGFGYRLNDLGDRLELGLPLDLQFDYAFRLQTGEIDGNPVDNSFQLTFALNRGALPKNINAGNTPIILQESPSVEEPKVELQNNVEPAKVEEKTTTEEQQSVETTTIEKVESEQKEIEVIKEELPVKP